MSEQHPFEIGGVFANRNGSYEVVSIDESSGQLVLRYLDSGEAIESSIELQARIWNNLGLEKQAAARREAEEEAQFLKGYGEGFSGLIDADFKTFTEGTTWRSRQNLPGRVARILSEGTHYTFVSWAIYRWPVAFLTHREDYEMAAYEMGTRKAKYTIELDEQNAYYGFYIERSDGPMDATWDWPRFMAAMRSNATLLKVVEQAEAEHGARFVGRMPVGEERLHYANELDTGGRSIWDERSMASYSVEQRVDWLAQMPEDRRGEVYIVAHMPKRQAIDAGLGVADAMAALLRHLLPVYRASVE